MFLAEAERPHRILIVHCRGDAFRSLTTAVVGARDPRSPWTPVLAMLAVCGQGERLLRLVVHERGWFQFRIDPKAVAALLRSICTEH